MSHSLRFLGFAVAAWVGVRALSLGVIPGAEALAFDLPTTQPKQSATIPPLLPSDLAPPESPPPADVLAGGYPASYPPGAGYPAFPAYAPAYPAYAPYPSYPPRAYPVPVYASWPAPAPVREPVRLPRSRQSPAAGYELAALDDTSFPYSDPVPALDDWPLSRIASSSRPRRAIASPASSTPLVAARLDRLQMSSWAMLRARPALINTPNGLASGGTLGGSQAGARLLWRFNRKLAASLRSSAPLGVGQGGGEVAAGVRYQPFPSIPIALTAERRLGFGAQHGNGGFALFAEGGVYDRPIYGGFLLDSYLQAGVVGARDRMGFVDGSATLTRPIWRSLSGGIGVWGGKQPGLGRLDVGPRLSLRIGRSMRVHVDYRYNVAGNAQPGSGAVLTLAGDF